MSLFRWLTTPALATALAVGAFAPAPASARDDLIRVIVDLGDVVIRAGHPYYRHGGYGYNDRLIVDRDRYGRPIYYRYVPRSQYRPPYGNAYGHNRYGDDYNRYTRRVCDSRGRCRVQYYDPRYDRYDDDRYGRDRRGRHHDDDRYDDRYDDHGRRHGRR